MEKCEHAFLSGKARGEAEYEIQSFHLVKSDSIAQIEKIIALLQKSQYHASKSQLTNEFTTSLNSLLYTYQTLYDTAF